MDKQWKVVPVTLTDEMRNAALQAVMEWHPDFPGKVYASMLAAAPQPPSASDDLEGFEKWRHTQADSLRRCGYPDAADAFIRLGSVQWAGWQARAALAPSPGVDAAEQKPVPGTVAWVQNGIANFIADNWPMRKYNLAEIEAGIRAIEIRVPAVAAPSPAASAEPGKFKLGDVVRKAKGSQWHGTVVGTYSTALTPEGYAVESSTERGSVQIYPAAALVLGSRP